MQLVAFGSQDTWLTGSPQITFFRLVYRRHSLFACESILQTWNGSVKWNGRSSAVIARNGDLATSAVLEMTFMKNSAYGTTFYPSEAFLNQVTFSIGGQPIDTHPRDWFRIFSENFRSGDEKRAYQRLNDFVDGEADGTIRKMYLPLLFYWNRTVGLALPLIALQYHECRLDFQWSDSSSVSGIDPSYTPTADLYINYVFMDGSERRRTASQAQEVLVDAVQYTGAETITIGATQKQINLRTSFNHPVKMMSWVAANQTYGVYTGGPVGTTADAFAPMQSCTLQLNGSQRQSIRSGRYYSEWVPYETCQTLPMSGIYTWSPALDPRSTQPSGSINMSRIDTCCLQIVWKSANATATTVHDILTPETQTTAAATNLTEIRVYAFSYNILRIMNGMAGLACQIMKAHKSHMQCWSGFPTLEKHLYSQTSLAAACA